MMVSQCIQQILSSSSCLGPPRVSRLHRRHHGTALRPPIEVFAPSARLDEQKGRFLGTRMSLGGMDLQSFPYEEPIRQTRRSPPPARDHAGKSPLLPTPFACLSPRTITLGECPTRVFDPLWAADHCGGQRRWALVSCVRKSVFRCTSEVDVRSYPHPAQTDACCHDVALLSHDDFFARRHPGEHRVLLATFVAERERITSGFFS